MGRSILMSAKLARDRVASVVDEEGMGRRDRDKEGIRPVRLAVPVNRGKGAEVAHALNVRPGKAMSNAMGKAKGEAKGDGEAEVGDKCSVGAEAKKLVED